METGSNKSLYTLIAVVIFGIFLSLSYWLFQDELNNVLANVLDGTSESVNRKLNLMDDFITYGFNYHNPTNSMVIYEDSTQSVTFSSNGSTYWGEGLLFKAEFLDVNKKYILSYDITKLEGDIVKIGGHNLLGPITTTIDANASIESSTIVYPNDDLTHHIVVAFDTRNLVKEGTNVYVKNTTETYPNYYIQPNRGVSDNYYYKVKLDNISIVEVN